MQDFHQRYVSFREVSVPSPPLALRARGANASLERLGGVTCENRTSSWRYENAIKYLPIPSMGLVYLPTFTIKSSKCR